MRSRFYFNSGDIFPILHMKFDNNLLDSINNIEFYPYGEISYQLKISDIQSLYFNGTSYIFNQDVNMSWRYSDFTYCI